jgi:hypothetical protein
MKPVTLAKITLDFSRDYTEEINDIISSGEFTSVEDIKEYILNCTAEYSNDYHFDDDEFEIEIEEEYLCNMDNQLTNAQIEQIDLVNTIAYNAMCTLLGRKLDWDMVWIGELSDCMVDIACFKFGKKEMDVYPYIDND